MISHNVSRAARRGLSLIEVMVAIVVMAIMMTFVGHISSSVAQANRRNDVIAKRTFAMQQQANIIGAMQFSSLTATVLPASKNFTLGNFNYIRRVSLTTTGTTSQWPDDRDHDHHRAADELPERHAAQGVAHDAPQLSELRRCARYGLVLRRIAHDQSPLINRAPTGRLLAHRSPGLPRHPRRPRRRAHAL